MNGKCLKGQVLDYSVTYVGSQMGFLGGLNLTSNLKRLVTNQVDLFADNKSRLALPENHLL